MKRTKLHASVYVHPTAVIIGNVHLGKNVFIGPHAILRADEPDTSIIIEDGCNIQDGVIIHALTGSSVRVGEHSSLSHGCVVHGPCTIGKECFIGFKSVVFRATLGDNVFIKYSAVIENVTVPNRKFIDSGRIINSAFRVFRLPSIHKEDMQFAQNVIATNKVLLKKYRAGKVR